jgi:simple sugar transport system permease protein/ribose transport system permease protein
MRRFVKRSDIGIIAGCIFVFALFSLWNPQQWFNWGTITNIGQYTAILGLLAIGQTFVILIREIDLFRRFRLGNRGNYLFRFGEQ